MSVLPVPRHTGDSQVNRWTRSALRALEWVAEPALAGLAFCLLCLGVVTWLPAMAATADALRRWRDDGEQRAFTATLAAFGPAWRLLWRDGLIATAAFAVLAANLVFLAGQAHPAAFALLAAQAGIGAALIAYHLALAAQAAYREPQATARTLRRQAMILAFGAPARGLALLAAAVLAPLAALPLAVGPLLFGPTLPLLLALAFARRARDGG